MTHIFANDRTPGFSFADDVRSLQDAGWNRSDAINYVTNGLRIKRTTATLAQSTFACGFETVAVMLDELHDCAAYNAACDARYNGGK